MLNPYILCMFLSVMVASVSQILLKKSAMKEYSSVIREYLNILVILGYGMMMCSMVLTVIAYSGMEFKNGPIIESLGNVIVLILSYFVFKEKISIRKIVGIACIILGIIVFYS